MNTGFLPAIGCLAAMIISPGSGTGVDEKAPKSEIKQLTYLALGDSYTIGESVAAEERWPIQLANALVQANFAMDTPTIIARTGWTTGELKTAIAASEITGPYHLVSLLIGVNNQYRGLDIAVFVKEFKELLAIAIRFAGNDPDRVFVVSIPDWGVTPFADGRDRDRIAEEIDRYNQIKQAECKARGVQFFNITDISRLAANDDSLLAGDGLHPSGSMYGEWVKRFAKDVADMLQADRP